MTLECDAKLEEKLTCGLENDMMKFSKLGHSLDPFKQSRKCMSLKITGDLCVMT